MKGRRGSNDSDELSLSASGFSLAVQQLEIAKTRKHLTELERKAAADSIKLLITALQNAIRALRDSRDENLAATEEVLRWKAAVRSHNDACGEETVESSWSDAETSCEDG